MTDAGIHWRPLRHDDAPAWVELVGAIEVVDRFGEILDAGDFDEFLATPGFDPERDGLVVEDPDERMIACGWAQGAESAAEDGYSIELWGGVHPDWRGRGIGRDLLARTEKRAEAIHRERHPDLPGHAELGALDFHVDRIALCERSGYSAVRHWFDMERRLDEPLDEGSDPLPPGLRLVPFEPALDDAVREARNEAFAGHWGSVERSPEEWTRLYTGARHFREDLSFCLLDGDSVAALALTQVYPEDAVAAGWTEAWLGTLGTRPHRRGQGLASALLHRVLVASRDAGLDRTALRVDSANATGALALYERHGFQARSRAVTYRKTLV